VRRAALACALLFARAPEARADGPCGPLFVVERSVNANVVVYEAVRGADGRMDPKKPIRVFWRMYAEDGREAGLNFFERIRAYGVEVAGHPGPDTFLLRMKAFPGRPLVLRDQGGCAEVVTEIGGRKAVLSRVFVSSTRGLFPSVAFVDVFGKDAETEAPLAEHIETHGRTR
jgi:hypothetical protein